MKKGLWVAGVTAMYWVLAAAPLLARAGGGRGGSLGAARSSGGIRSSGVSSGFSGGFFPFPVFFGGGGGGGGIITLLIFAIIAFFIFRMIIRRRYNQGNNNHNGIGKNNKVVAFGQPVDLEGRAIKNDRSRFAKAIKFARENMDYFAQKFPRWDYGVLNGRVRQVFSFMQDAWSRQDLSEGPDYLAPQLLTDYQTKLEAMKSRGERNIIKDPDLSEGNIDFVFSQLDASGERFVARIFASLIDYTVDSSGRLVTGEQDNRLYFNEFWQFAWQDDKWKLEAIFQEDSLEAAKWARMDGV